MKVNFSHFNTFVKIDSRTTCEIWVGRKIGKYGVYVHNGKTYKAHRVSCGIDSPHTKIYNICGNTLCVNEDHWSLTPTKIVTSGGRPKGIRKGKLSSKDAVEIRKLAVTTNISEIAQKYGCSPRTISNILKKRSFVDR